MTKYLKQALARLSNFKRFKNEFLPSLPPQYGPAANLLFYYKLALTTPEKALGKKIESFRRQIPSLTSKAELNTYSSPHANTFKINENTQHVVPGDYAPGKLQSVIKTGSGVFKGILLRRIIEGTGRKRILELGTNTGFGSCYLASVKGVHLTTIEGSEDLCAIAEKNISRITQDFRIMNTLFDEAIDKLIEEKQQFDCVFIDGQHEKEATLYYTKRLKPLMATNAIYIYDDIYWSEGMNEAWQALFSGYEFVQGVDLQLVGVLEHGPNAPQKAASFNINDYLPQPEIYRKGY
jgi:hypothetical protein